jgi:hypothetical protein
MDEVASVGDATVPTRDVQILSKGKNQFFEDLKEANPALKPVSTTRQVFGQREE